ncbi:MAG: hypothetical protein GX921_09305 [Bacteroidales bacterium]|nr:hypothetical protein [Bacteroidales bacterium]
MSKKELPISFSLVHIEDNQFSTFEEMLDVEKPIQQEIGFGFGVDVENGAIAVSMEFVLHKGEKPLLKQNITCYFKISPKDFNKQLRKEKEVVLPCALAKHLAMLTVGTARGVLFANTKNTPFNEYLIGLINVDDMFNEDISIEF